MRFYYNPQNRVVYSEKTASEELKNCETYAAMAMGELKSYLDIDNEDELLRGYQREDEWCLVYIENLNNDDNTFHAVKMPFADNFVPYLEKRGINSADLDDKDASFTLIGNPNITDTFERDIPLKEAMKRLDVVWNSTEHREKNKIGAGTKWLIEFLINYKQEVNGISEVFCWTLMIDHFEL